MTAHSPTPSICILAAKDLRLNTRVARQATALERAGWSVTIVALEPPLLPTGTRISVLRVSRWHPLQRLEAALAWPRRHGSRLPRSPAPATSGATVPARMVNLLRRLAMPFGETINSLFFARAVRRSLARCEYDAIQAHDATSLRAAAALAKAGDAFFIYDAVEFVDSRARFSRGLVTHMVRLAESSCEARLIRRAHRVLTIGPGMAAWMQTRYHIAAPVVVRNCRTFEPRRRDERLRKVLELDDRERLVLFLNSAAPGRGLEEVLDAVARLSGNVHVAVLGDPGRDPIYRDLVKARAATFGLAGRLHFVPAVPPDDVVAYAAGADIGVIPFRGQHLNNYHALPNRLFEMVMARLPIAASAFPDMQALIEQYDIGATFDPERPASIAAALERLLDPGHRRELEEHLERAAAALCWENESQRYLDALAAGRKR